MLGNQRQLEMRLNRQLADIEKLFAQTSPLRHTMLFSATMPPERFRYFTWSNPASRIWTANART